MVKLSTTDDKDFELIPENEIVNVRVGDVDLHEFEYQDEKVVKLRWRFIVTDSGPWKGRQLIGDTSTHFTAHPNCRAYNWAVAITGKQYKTGDEFDTEDVTGLPARVIVRHKEGRGKRIWMQVREVLPLRPGQAVSQNTANPAPEEPPF